MSALPVEVLVLAGACVLGLVQVFLPVILKTRQYGLAWNLSSRGAEVPPAWAVTQRLSRAQSNFMETFPIAAALLLALVATRRTGGLGAVGAEVWLAARVIYLPLYGFGVAGWRTLAFLAGIVGIGMLAWRLLLG